MVVLNRIYTATESGVVAQFVGASEHQIAQPGSRVRLPQDVQVLVPDHVHEDKGTNSLQPAVSVQPVRHVPASIKAVPGGPLLEGFLAVEEHQPVGERVLALDEHARHFKQKGRAGAPVVGPDKLHPIQARSIVMARDGNDLGALPGNDPHQILHGDIPGRSRCYKGILIDINSVGRELPTDVLARLLQGLRARRPRSELDQALQVIKRPLSIKAGDVPGTCRYSGPVKYCPRHDDDCDHQNCRKVGWTTQVGAPHHCITLQRLDPVPAHRLASLAWRSPAGPGGSLSPPYFPWRRPGNSPARYRYATPHSPPRTPQTRSPASRASASPTSVSGPPSSTTARAGVRYEQPLVLPQFMQR